MCDDREEERMGTMGKQLNLETFNEILFGAFKEQTPENKYELLMVELQSGMMTKIEVMEDVIRDLNNGKPYHQNLEKVNNVNSNLDALAKQIDELIKAYPEVKKKAEESGAAEAIASAVGRDAGKEAE